MALQTPAAGTRAWEWNENHVSALYFSRNHLLQLAEQALVLPHPASIESQLEGLLVAAWCQEHESTPTLLQIQKVLAASEQELTLSVKTEEGLVAISSRCCIAEPCLDDQERLLVQAQWFHEQGILPIQVDDALLSRAYKLRLRLATNWQLPQFVSTQQHIQNEQVDALVEQLHTPNETVTAEGHITEIQPESTNPAAAVSHAIEIQPESIKPAPVVPSVQGSSAKHTVQLNQVVHDRVICEASHVDATQEATCVDEKHMVDVKQEPKNTDQDGQLHSLDVTVSHEQKHHVLQQPPSQPQQQRQHEQQQRQQWQQQQEQPQQHNCNQQQQQQRQQSQMQQQQQQQRQQQQRQQQPEEQQQEVQQHNRNHNQHQQSHPQSQSIQKRKQRAQQFKQLLKMQSQNQSAGNATLATQQNGAKPNKRPKHQHKQSIQHPASLDVQVPDSKELFHSLKESAFAAESPRDGHRLQQQHEQEHSRKQQQTQAPLRQQQSQVHANANTQPHIQAQHKQQQQNQHKQQGQKGHQQPGQIQKQKQQHKQQQRKQQAQQLPQGQHEHGFNQPPGVSKSHLPYVLKRIARKRQTQAQKSRVAALLAQYEPVADTTNMTHAQQQATAIGRYHAYEPYLVSPFNSNHHQPQQYEPHVPPMQVQLRRSIDCRCFNAYDCNQVARVRFSYHFVIQQQSIGHWGLVPSATYDGSFIACVHVYASDLKELNRQVNTPPTVQWKPDPHHVKNHVGFEQLDGGEIQLNRTANMHQLLPCVAGGYFLTYNGQVAVLTEVDNCGTAGLRGYTDALVATSHTQGAVLGSGELVVPHPVHGKLSCKLDLFTHTSPYVNALLGSVAPATRTRVQSQEALLALMRVKCIPPPEQQ